MSFAATRIVTKPEHKDAFDYRDAGVLAGYDEMHSTDGKQDGILIDETNDDARITQGTDTDTDVPDEYADSEIANDIQGNIPESPKIADTDIVPELQPSLSPGDSTDEDDTVNIPTFDEDQRTSDTFKQPVNTTTVCSSFLNCLSPTSNLPRCSFADPHQTKYVQGHWVQVSLNISMNTTVGEALNSFAYNYQPRCNEDTFRCHIAEPNSCGPKALRMLQYHWQPDACSLQPFSAHALNALWASKRILFIGDSLMRQMYNSIRFLLREYWAGPEEGTRKDPEYCLLRSGAKMEFVWSKFLVDERYLPRKLHLPENNWPDRVKEADYIVMNVGHHWHKKDKSFGKYSPMVDMVLDVLKKQFAGDRIFFRTSTPGYYGCESMQDPVDEMQLLDPQLDVFAWRKPIELERMWYDKAMAIGMQDRFQLLNVSFSGYRADAHLAYKIRNNRTTLDCLHWCMPGVPDYWNYLLFNALM